MSNTSLIQERTTNAGLAIINYAFPNWKSAADANTRLIDTALGNLGYQSKGPWEVNTAYIVGEVVVSGVTAYRCEVSHTSATSGTLADDLAANPTYWSTVSTSINVRTAFSLSTAYYTNDVVPSGNQYLIATSNFTSDASDVATDIAAGRFDVIFDSTVAKAAETSAVAAKDLAETAASTATAQRVLAETAVSDATDQVALATAQVVLAEDEVAAATAQVALAADEVALAAAQVALATAQKDLAVAQVVLTNADVALTNADVVLTNADVVLTNADAVQTALDRVATGDDAAAAALSAASIDPANLLALAGGVMAGDIDMDNNTIADAILSIAGYTPKRIIHIDSGSVSTDYATTSTTTYGAQGPAFPITPKRDDTKLIVISFLYIDSTGPNASGSDIGTNYIFKYYNGTEYVTVGSGFGELSTNHTGTVTLRGMGIQVVTLDQAKRRSDDGNWYLRVHYNTVYSGGTSRIKHLMYIAIEVEE